MSAIWPVFFFARIGRCELTLRLAWSLGAKFVRPSLPAPRPAFMKTARGSDDALPLAKRPHASSADRDDDLATFRLTWSTCSEHLSRARSIARVDAPPSSGPPYSVAQMESWGRRRLENLVSDPSTQVPPPATLRRMCADTLKHLASHMRARASTDGARVTTQLATDPADKPASQWTALPPGVQEVLLLRHSPRALEARLTPGASAGSATEEPDLEGLVEALRPLRALADKLALWDALLLPVPQALLASSGAAAGGEDDAGAIVLSLPPTRPASPVINSPPASRPASPTAFAASALEAGVAQAGAGEGEGEGQLAGAPDGAAAAQQEGAASGNAVALVSVPLPPEPREPAARPSKAVTVTARVLERSGPLPCRRVDPPPPPTAVAPAAALTTSASGGAAASGAKPSHVQSSSSSSSSSSSASSASSCSHWQLEMEVGLSAAAAAATKGVGATPAAVSATCVTLVTFQEELGLHAAHGTFDALPEATLALLDAISRSEIALQPPAQLLGGGSFVRVVQLLARAVGEAPPAFRVWCAGC